MGLKYLLNFESTRKLVSCEFISCGSNSIQNSLWASQHFLNCKYFPSLYHHLPNSPALHSNKQWQKWLKIKLHVYLSIYILKSYTLNKKVDNIIQSWNWLLSQKYSGKSKVLVAIFWNSKHACSLVEFWNIPARSLYFLHKQECPYTFSPTCLLSLILSVNLTGVRDVQLAGKTLFLDVSARLFLDEISIWSGEPNKADGLPKCGWASSSSLRAQIE